MALTPNSSRYRREERADRLRYRLSPTVMVTSAVFRSAPSLAMALSMYTPGAVKRVTELWESLGAPGSVGEMSFDRVNKLDPTGWSVHKGASLFPKADVTAA